jgi:DNA-binding NtrC family response regulator
MMEKTPLLVRDSNRKRAPLTGVRVLASPDAELVGLCFPLLSQLSCGREEGGQVNLPIADRTLSRLHVTFIRTESGAHVVDHASTNGTFVETHSVRELDIAPNTIIRIGETILFFGTLALDEEPHAKASPLLGCSLPMVTLRQRIAKMAVEPDPVLILGPTGSGKELVARALHEQSGRSGSLVAVNCAAVPETLAEGLFFGHRKGTFTGATQDTPGFFQSANHGTLFLDEVGDLPPSLQAKLLRVLDKAEVTALGASDAREVDVRVVAATNVDLEERMKTGAFRDDLYARLQVLTLHTPSIGERREDILLLFHHFLSKQPRRFESTVDFLERLLMCPWPYNVRDISAWVRKLAFLPDDVDTLSLEYAPALREGDLGPEIPVETKTEPSRSRLIELLTEQKGQVAGVAKQLGRDRKQVYRWIEKHGLDADDYRST